MELETFTACKKITKRLQSYLSSRDEFYKEVNWMFIFTGNTGCNTNTNCNTIWQILSRICGFGC